MADTWPSWRYGPNGQAAVFVKGDDVPEGWVDRPSGPVVREEKAETKVVRKPRAKRQ